MMIIKNMIGKEDHRYSLNHIDFLINGQLYLVKLLQIVLIIILSISGAH